MNNIIHNVFRGVIRTRGFTLTWVAAKVNCTFRDEASLYKLATLRSGNELDLALGNSNFGWFLGDEKLMFQQTFIQCTKVTNAHVTITDRTFFSVLFMIGGQVEESLRQETVHNLGLFNELGKLAFLRAE